MKKYTKDELEYIKQIDELKKEYYEKNPELKNYKVEIQSNTMTNFLLFLILIVLIFIAYRITMFTDLDILIDRLTK